MNRRKFLALAAASCSAHAGPKQTFTAGIVPAGRNSATNQVDAFWSHCDEVASLGFHHIEFNNTRAQIAEYYSDRISEFKDQMAKRNLTLAGLALFSRAAESGERQALVDQHVRLGRFLESVGGRYITHMIATGEILNEPSDEDAYRRVDVKIWANNADEIGKRLLQQYGVKLAYHPEQGEVRGGLYQRFLQSTDERYVYFLPDTGHLASGGADAVEVCKSNRKRLACVHLKDFTPHEVDGKATKAGNAPFGEGVVDLAGVVKVLRETEFAGYVMSESGGTNQQMHDYMVRALSLSI